MYPVKHFLATILLAPILFIIYELTIFKSAVSADIYFTLVILSFGFALPTYIVYHNFYVQLKNRTIRPGFQKLILNGIALMGVVITMKILNGPDSPFFNPFTLIYSIAVLLTSLLFNLMDKQVDKPIG